jgi:lambda family phage tail tape measure protein
MALNMDAMLRIKADVQGENNIRRLGNSMQGLQGRAKNAALGFNSLKGAVGGFAAAIAGSAIVGGLGAMVKSAVNLGDELGKMSARTGVAQGALIGLRNAAALSDVENEKLQAGLTRLNVAMVAAADGNAAAEAKFKRLGISVKNAAGEVRPTDQVFKDLGDRFKDMPNGAEKAAAAVSIFGKAGADLIPLLNGGREAMEAFNFELSDEFAARSELFNDTLTILGFKTEGFKLQLADALLPALQSILEVFGDLFDTKNDWTALFEVIKLGLRAVATVLFATIKLVDVFVKTIVYTFDAIDKALRGDFAAAGEALSQGFGAGLEQAKRDFALIGKLFTDAPAPTSGLGRRRLGGMEDPAAADREAKTRAAASRKAAKEEERLEQQRQTLQEQAFDLQEKLRRSIEDTRAAYAAVGLSAAEALSVQRGNELTDATRTTNDLVDNLVDLANKFAAVGVSFDMKPTIDLINEYGKALANVADAEYNQGLKDLLPSLEEYDAKIAEVTRGKTELTELEKLNAQVNLLQLDILAQTNPALAEHVDLLRQRAAALDEATKKQFGKQFSQSFEDGIKSMGDLAGNLGSSFASAFEGMANQLTEFVTTGKANFRDFAASVLKDISRMIIRYAIFNAVRGILNAFNPAAAAAPLVQAANGRVFAQNGIQPFARGGIVDRPTLFPFAKGTGLMGEAGPEAIIPLKRGRDGKLGVAGGGGGTTNVVVNVDASGSKVEGDQSQAKALGNVISAAVQSELVRQKRPGGLLA